MFSILSLAKFNFIGKKIAENLIDISIIFVEIKIAMAYNQNPYINIITKFSNPK